MVASEPSRYVHGTAPAEQARLTALNALMNPAALRELGLRGGERILDVGSGLGQLTRDMARAAGRPVLGIELDREQLAEATRQAAAAGEGALAVFRRGDVHDLPLEPGEWGAFDVAHARFILEHVGDPAAVVRGMTRAVRPGGRVVLQDEDHEILRLWPEPAGVAAVWRAYIESYRRDGHEPAAGRRLVEWLVAAGARPTRCTWIFFGACAGEERFPALAENMAVILEGARAAIEAAGPVAPAAFDAALAALRAWARRPDAALWFAIHWAEGVRPETAA